MIEHLPLLTPDPARADRVRARCHAQLERERLRTAMPPRQLDRVIVGACGLYLSAVVLFALQVFNSR